MLKSPELFWYLQSPETWNLSSDLRNEMSMSVGAELFFFHSSFQIFFNQSNKSQKTEKADFFLKQIFNYLTNSDNHERIYFEAMIVTFSRTRSKRATFAVINFHNLCHNPQIWSILWILNDIVCLYLSKTHFNHLQLNY